MLEVGIFDLPFCLLQAKLENTKTELQQKIRKRKTRVDEINTSLQSCKVSCKGHKHYSPWIVLD